MYILFMVIGILMILIGVGMIYHKKMIKKTWIKTLGKIISYEEYTEGFLDSFNQFIPVEVYRPTIEFKTSEGKNIRFISEIDNNCIKSGDIVSVSYRKDDPNKCTVSNYIDDISFELTIIFVGAIILLILLICLLV